MIDPGIIISAIHWVDKLINNLDIQSHRQGLNTYIDVTNRGKCILRDLKISIVDTDLYTYYWEDEANEKTIEITQLSSGEPQSYAIMSSSLEGSTLELKVSFKGPLKIREEKSFYVHVYSMIDQVSR